MSVEGLTAALIADRRLGRNRLVYVILILAKLPVKVRIVMRIHTALEKLSIDGSIKEPCRDPQRGYAITASPSFTDFAAL